MIATRRGLIAGAVSLGFTSACMKKDNDNDNDNSDVDAPSQRLEIDNRVRAAKAYLYNNIEGTQELRERAVGVLIMPLVTEISFLYGGAHGRGALQVDEQSIAYYSATKGSIGWQIGAQQYAHALFFLTNKAFDKFRSSKGSFSLGADIYYAAKAEGGAVGVDTDTALSPIVAVVFAQAGLAVGVSLEGTQYTKLDL